MKKFTRISSIFLISILTVFSFSSLTLAQDEVSDTSEIQPDNFTFLIASEDGDDGKGDGGDGDEGSGDSSNGDEGGPVTLTNPLGEDTIIGVINNIITGLRDTIAPPLVAIAVLYGGFLMLFAGGDPERFQKGKKAILYAMVGYAIILVAGGITSLIKDIIGG